MENLKSNKKALFALAIGGFGIGLTEFVIMGILTEVSGSLGITIPQAGHFIAAYALGVVVGAPLLTGLGSKLTPKKMLFLLMIWFTVFNTLSGLATGYTSLLFMRFLSGIPHGAFFGIGAVVATKLAKKGKGAQAISIMFSGLTVANVIGVPIGTYLGQQFSWSVSFYLVGFVGLLALGSIYLWMPKIEVDESEEKLSVSQGLKNTELWALIALTTIGTGGFFAWYSYVAPLITDVAGLPNHFVGYAMMLAGLGMVVGNFLGAKMAELFSPLKAVIISLSVMCGILVLNMFIATNPYLLMIMTFVIGAISFTVATPIQMAIINTSKGSEMLGSSMNQSAFNMGNASGAYLAGLPIAFGYGIIYSSLVGAVLAFSGVAIAVAILIVRKRKEIKYRKMAMSC
ncbi:DHA1 family arabinose polymer transporter-like MFS transporter [Maribacter spongiicola]|uniref:DHA1 family arabinose polymer transporter-like MFS transporter n=1 Tax=Maribacter spongiicola TaxID=1206753 RepID=A0A4R7K391_9FLAO|nr:MFS transporter [Maribacter spongiicola]TDT44986.1 DHA1 family arabinose polymer transporter-like MFS transporter [Maribacter spongiicola]